jgi:hypothetical protein
VTVRPNPDAPIVGSAPHELRGNLNFSEGGLSDPMAAYWAICGLMRQHGGGTTVETEIPWGVEPHPAAPVDDEDEPMESVEISFYYGTDDDGEMAGMIEPLPEFDLPIESGMWEPRINVKGFGERKADFHIRPRYANMTHVETGNDIPSPFDHDGQPDHGYNVHITGANLEPDEYLHVLQHACKALAEDVDENWDDDRFGEPLPTSNIIQYERYLRISRKLSEKLTRQGGAFHSLAMLLSDQAGSKGAFFWDNRDVQGHMSRLLHDSSSLGTMIPGHQHGGQLKSYHPENVHSDPEDPLYYPKFGALYTGQMNDVTLNDTTASWSERHDLGRDLEERLVNVLAWSGIPIDPDALGAEAEEGVGAFIGDWHFRAEESDLEPELVDDPTPEIERSQESMIVRSLQRMTNSGLDLTEQLIADGGHARYDELADGAEVSASTVYRWLQRMGEAVESDNGVITFHSQNLREQFEEIVGRTAMKFVQTVDNAMRRADTVLEQDAYQRRAGEAFENWRQKWGAELAEDGRVLNLGTCLPQPDRELDAPVDAGDVVRDGLEAWHEDGNKTGSFPHEIHWDSDRGHHSERLDDLLEAAKKDHRSEAVQQLAERTFEGLDVVDAISEVKRMIDAGSSWSADEIQAAIEEAGFDFDVRDAAEPEFHIPG